MLFIYTIVRREWRFLAVTILSCGVATMVATFQFAVFNSFRQASAVIPHMVEADYWVSAATVESFDFPAPFAEDHAAALARFFPYGHSRRIAFGFVPWRSPSGRRGNVALVGVENLTLDGAPLGDLAFVANASDLDRLDLASGTGGGVPDQQATIGSQTLQFAGTVNSLSTYLGAPYVLVEFETARGILGLGPSDVAFVAGSVGQGQSPEAAIALARAQMADPEIRIFTADEFAASSMRYWLRKTGAGLAIGLAAILASFLTIILLSNAVLRFIQRYYTDLVSLLGHGATRRDVRRITAGVAGVVATITCVAAVAVTPVMVLLFQPILPWVAVSMTDLVAPVTSSLVAFAVALLSANRTLAAFAPDAVFRT